MNQVTENSLAHYGVKRRSGRYPWGSGDDPYQRTGDLISRDEELKKRGFTEKERADAMGMKSTTELRTQLRIAKHERRQLKVDRAKSLKEDGLGDTEIGRIMGLRESSVRSLLNESTSIRKNRANNTADVLRKIVEDKKMLDVGVGVERELGVSKDTLKEALKILENEGYPVHGARISQVTNPGKKTTVKVLCVPDTPSSEPYQNPGAIQSVREYHSRDNGNSFQKLQYPASINSDRVKVRYGDEGGLSKDGVIELRRGVKDLDLGNSHYAQVRILVDGTHYLKGMAIYSDDMPDGVDIMFNTNKKSGTPKEDVMKKIKKEDPNNPFGAAIKAEGQSMYIDSDGKTKLSAINKLKEEGDWDDMSVNLSSQFLSKQPIQLINKQLNLTYADRMAEYDEICSLENPTLKRKLLNDFADDCDGASMHLKAAALPRQRTQVILPVDGLRDNEIYAPNYNDGEQVALVRYPHGHISEIPILTVNNKNKVGKSVVGPNAIDAVGINSKVAERLSGADFDGDTVTVIPTNNGKVKIASKPKLQELEGFDAKEQYAEVKGMSYMTKSMTQKEMGKVSNLITDMTLKGAPDEDIAKALKHSMVVIDAEKHKLNYKQSEKDNQIQYLKETYQVRTLEDGTVKAGGASTLLSRRKQEVQVPERKGGAIVDKETGKVSYRTSGRKYYDADGNLVDAMEKVKLFSTVDDLRTLSTGTKQENAYADYGNKMKALANQARKEAKSTPRLQKSASAAKTYEAEVKKLNLDLEIAETNAPRERRAQAIANSKIKAMIQDNPELASKSNKKELKKYSQMAITEARFSVGASGKDTRIQITPKQWEAIQAGAISDTKLAEILRYADSKQVREYAMPKSTTKLSQAKINKIKSMMASGYTNQQIADDLGVSISTINNYK